MKLLHIIPSVDPRCGGTIECVNQISAAHQNLGVRVEICSLDAPESECVASSKIPIHALGPALGKYGYSSILVTWLKANAHKYDAVIVNGLWQYAGFAVWRALAGTSTPYFVFVHGMLDPWFKRAYPLKHLKKWLYWPWAEYRVLRDAENVIFTCEEECLLAKESFWLYKVKAVVTALGIRNPPVGEDEFRAFFISQYPHLLGKRLLLFLSRIEEKKGCDLLIEAFAKVAERDVRLHLVMAGPDQAGGGVKLKAQALSLGIEQRITWTGMLQGDLKWGAYYAAEVFCLPSHQENFGIVVAEALACGKPVLISNKVNIWREIQADGAGLVAEDTLGGTVANLERWLDMSKQEFHSMQALTKICFTSRFHVQRAAVQLLEIIKKSK
jgi:glycosyltransferase involved in cell wall biosynthesis